jgi:hypothetical protein
LERLAQGKSPFSLGIGRTASQGQPKMSDIGIQKIGSMAKRGWEGLIRVEGI